MEVTVKLNYLRIAPRKVRQAANLVRGKKAEQADAMLDVLANKPGKCILKLLRSGVAAAKNDYKLDSDNLYISEIFVNEGPKLKRWEPVSRGSGHPLWKRGSHITLTLGEIKPTAKSKIAKIKKEQKKTAETVEAVETTEKDSTSEITARNAAKPRFEKRDSRNSKGRDTMNRIFRRKAI
ncbi:MAG: 50S ribosomal protein L22 [Candidatus Staskawiczbacteria bacterium]|jgi:large subunit ribosomal protein L22